MEHQSSACFVLVFVLRETTILELFVGQRGTVCWGWERGCRGSILATPCIPWHFRCVPAARASRRLVPVGMLFRVISLEESLHAKAAGPVAAVCVGRQLSGGVPETYSREDAS